MFPGKTVMDKEGTTKKGRLVGQEYVYSFRYFLFGTKERNTIFLSPSVFENVIILDRAFFFIQSFIEILFSIFYCYYITYYIYFSILHFPFLHYGNAFLWKFIMASCFIRFSLLYSLF